MGVTGDALCETSRLLLLCNHHNSFCTMTWLPEVEPVDQALAVNLGPIPAGRGQYRPDSHTVHISDLELRYSEVFWQINVSNSTIMITALTNPTDFLKPSKQQRVTVVCMVCMDVKPCNSWLMYLMINDLRLIGSSNWVSGESYDYSSFVGLV